MPISDASSSTNNDTRGDVLRQLKNATEPLSIKDIAGVLDVHPNTVRFHLDSLLSHGQVERVSARHRVPGRPPQLFRAVTGMDPTGPRHYQLLAEVLADTLAEEPDRARRAVEAGRHWGRRQGAARDADAESSEPVDRLVTLLDDIGFAPEPDIDHEQPTSDVRQINLRHCPFLELAVDHPDLACPVHLGLMQGALRAWRSPVTVGRLDAFVEPDRCVAVLATAQES